MLVAPQKPHVLIAVQSSQVVAVGQSPSPGHSPVTHAHSDAQVVPSVGPSLEPS